MDIDKVQKYPVTFVIKTNQSIQDVLKLIEQQAKIRYTVNTLVIRYMEAIDEIINIPQLVKYFDKVLESHRGINVIEEIVLQSRLEFNMDEEVV